MPLYFLFYLQFSAALHSISIMKSARVKITDVSFPASKSSPIYRRKRMRYVLPLLIIALSLSGCSTAPIKLDKQLISQLAPDVPPIDKQTQKEAAKEIQQGNAPALSKIAGACLITRDEARDLKK